MIKSEIYRFGAKHLIVSAVISLISTIIRYSYVFGIRGVHLSQLPIIYRVLDSNYLINDFYVNEASSSIARLGYAYFIAVFTLLAGSIDYLPLIYFIFTLISNLVLAIVTFLFARKIFNGSGLSGIIAVALVMSLSTFTLGYTAEVYTTTLIPRTIARPLIFAAVYLAFAKNRLPLGIFLCGISSLFQPLYGLLFGFIILASSAVTNIIVKSILNLETQKKLLFAFLIYTSFFLISMIPQLSQETIGTDAFIYILAYFRAPHHYLPSTFEVLDYMLAVSFFLAFGISWLRWSKMQYVTRELKTNISTLVVFVILLCLGGYVFVEIFPSRLWTTAQTFRLLIIIKWLGLIFIGGAIEALIQEKKLSQAIFYMFSLFNPLLIGFAFLVEWIRDNIKKVFPHFNIFFKVYSLIMYSTFIVLTYLYTPILYWLPLWFLYIIIFTIVYKNRQILSIIASVGILLIMLNIFGVSIPEERKISKELNERIINRNIMFGLYHDEFGEPGRQVAIYARENTPDESIFLTPVYFGQFRLVAKRAIVVDFQGFPFSDDGILEWHSRMLDSYGEPDQFGFAAIDELNENYKVIDDHRLAALKNKYDISYAVIFNETKTDYAVLFQNSRFKIVELD